MSVPARGASILGVASALPRARVSVAELAAQFGLEVDVLRGLGLEEKPVARDDDEHPSDLATRAAGDALAAAGIAPAEVGLVVFTGVSRDHPPSWSVAVEIARRLGLACQGAYDLMIGCAGTVVALDHASRWAEDHPEAPCAIVASAERWHETLSPHGGLPPTTLAHADGGAAVVVGPSRRTAEGALAPGACRIATRAAQRTAPQQNGFLIVPAGGTREPATAATVAAHRHVRHARITPGPEAKRVYVDSYCAVIDEVLALGGVARERVALVALNQTRREVREAILARLELGGARTIETYGRLGHLGGADLLIAIEVAARRGVLGPGAVVLAGSSPAAFAALLLDVAPSPPSSAADASLARAGAGAVRFPDGDGVLT